MKYGALEANLTTAFTTYIDLALALTSKSDDVTIATATIPNYDKQSGPLQDSAMSTRIPT
jgi:hypothetical protein